MTGNCLSSSELKRRCVPRPPATVVSGRARRGRGGEGEGERWEVGGRGGAAGWGLSVHGGAGRGG